MKTYVTLLFLLITFGIKAQSATEGTIPDTRLYEAFGKDYVDFLTKNNPDLIVYYNFFLDNSFVMVKHAPEKIAEANKQIPLLKLNSENLTMDKPDINTGVKSVNILKYNYTLQPTETTTYRLDDSGILIVLYSSTQINEMYKKFTER